ncbi:MAG: 3-hydroxyacyl-CoA dehydrogenase family protein, partial [Bacteroidia bacterium]|nr:3-hydroxyacyl-CoA dehydrogenase family protein [Bacteroidia bacterium]
YIKRIKKTPIVVNDSRGFYTSRVFATYVKEGLAMLEEGIPPTIIEYVGKLSGMPVGPLALADEVSIELLHHIVKQTEQDLGITIDEPAARIGKLFVEEYKRFGKKSGKGFYDYSPDGKKSLWNELQTIFPPTKEKLDLEELKTRFLFVQTLEAIRCLEEGVLRSPQDGDVGSILGWGFAPFTGGVMSYVDMYGPIYFVRKAEELTQKYGERFQITQILRRMYDSGKGFYAHWEPTSLSS